MDRRGRAREIQEEVEVLQLLWRRKGAGENVRAATEGVSSANCGKPFWLGVA